MEEEQRRGCLGRNLSKRAVVLSLDETPLFGAPEVCELAWIQLLHRLLKSRHRPTGRPPRPHHQLPDMHGRLLIVNEYGARLMLMDAIRFGRQSYLRQALFVPSYFLSLLDREREKSVGEISDIYSLDDSWAERL